MKSIRSAQQVARASVAGLLLVALTAPAAAVDLKTADGAWTFSIDGNVNANNKRLPLSRLSIFLGGRPSRRRQTKAAPQGERRSA